MAVITLEEAGFPDVVLRKPQRVLYALGGAYLEWTPWLSGNFDSSYHPTETEIKSIYHLNGTGVTRWGVDREQLNLFDMKFYWSMSSYFGLSLQLKSSEMTDAVPIYYFTNDELQAEMTHLLGEDLLNSNDLSAMRFRPSFPKTWANQRYRLVHDLPILSFYNPHNYVLSTMITEDGTLYPRVYNNGNGVQWDESRGNFYQLTWSVPAGYRFIRGKLWFKNTSDYGPDFGTGASPSCWSPAYEFSTNVFRFAYQLPSQEYTGSSFNVRAIAEFGKTTD